MTRLATCALLLTIVLGACSKGPTAGGPSPAGGGRDGGGLEPYGDVITGDAVSDSGLFTLQTVGDKLYFEIPDSLLDRDMLLVSRIAQTPSNLSPFINAGSKVAEQVLRWQRNGDKVLLRTVSYRSVASDTLPIYLSVQSNNFAPIIRSFEIETVNPADSALVIDVTDLFVKDIPAISGLSNNQRTQFKVRRLDENRTFIEYARSYPLNVDVRHTLTFEASEPPSNSRTGTISMQMHQTMVLLSDSPMRPRLADPRVGWFTVQQIDFGLDEQKAASRSYIRRWRLEPKDPAAYARGELVEPVNL